MHRRRQNRVWIAIALCVILSACGGDIPLIEASIETPDTPETALFLGQLPPGWVEAMEVMRGICFESAQGAAFDEAVFVLRSDADLQNLYDLADNSQLCRQPVERVPFDFSTGLTLVGTWSDGTGCTAHHDIEQVEQDASARRLTITLRHSTGGDCPYELVRPWWVAIPGIEDYAIDVIVLE